MSDLAFPNKPFAEFFLSARPWNHPQDIKNRSGASMATGKITTYGPLIGHYLVVSGTEGHRSFFVEPAPFLVDWIRENMVQIQNDTLHFQAVIRDDGSALLLVSYGQIIGSRWLAVVPASTISATE